MTWGPYWMFYCCDTCMKKYKFSLEDVEDKNFGDCPVCKQKGKFVGESKALPDSPEQYETIF